MPVRRRTRVNTGAVGSQWQEHDHHRSDLCRFTRGFESAQQADFAVERGQLRPDDRKDQERAILAF
jgi:hypothetical protein